MKIEITKYNVRKETFGYLLKNYYVVLPQVLFLAGFSETFTSKNIRWSKSAGRKSARLFSN